MSYNIDGTVRDRIYASANRLFASSVPAGIDVSSSSRFEIVATTVSGGGIRAKLLQWHRVGRHGMRCVIALYGPVRVDYNEAAVALANDLELLVEQQSHPDQQEAPGGRTSYYIPTSFSPLLGTSFPATPRTPSTGIASQNSPHPSSRLHSSSVSSNDAVRPSTAPPGPLPETTNYPPLPTTTAAAAEPFTPKRSLTSRLSPFPRRWRQRDSQAAQPSTPGQQQMILGPRAAPPSEKRTSSLQKWTSMKKKAVQPPNLLTTPRSYFHPTMGELTLSQTPSPSLSPATIRGSARVVPGQSPASPRFVSSPTRVNWSNNKPRGPRMQPYTQVEESEWEDEEEPPASRAQSQNIQPWDRKDNLSATLAATPTREPRMTHQKRQLQRAGSISPPTVAVEGGRASQQPDFPTFPPSRPLDNYPIRATNNPSQSRPVSSSTDGIDDTASNTSYTSNVWDEIDELERELCEHQRQDTQRRTSQMQQEQAAAARQRREAEERRQPPHQMVTAAEHVGPVWQAGGATQQLRQPWEQQAAAMRLQRGAEVSQRIEFFEQNRRERGGVRESEAAAAVSSSDGSNRLGTAPRPLPSTRRFPWSLRSSK